MEQRTPPQKIQFEIPIQMALDARNGDALLQAIEQAEPDVVLQSIGLRLQLKDHWLKRKEDVARLADAVTSDNLESLTRQVLVAGDTDLARLAGTTQPVEGDSPPDPVRARIGRLQQELRTKEPDERIVFMERFGTLTPYQLSDPTQLLEWAHDWRNTIVERTWDVVGDWRESGYSEATQAQFREQVGIVNHDLDQLIQGSVFTGNYT